MPETTVIPAGASAVVMPETHRRDDRRDDLWDQFLVNQQARLHESDVASRERDAAAAALAAAHGVDEVKDARRDVVGVLGTGFGAAALAGAHTDGKVAAGFAHVNEEMCEGFDATGSAIAASGAATLAAICASASAAQQSFALVSAQQAAASKEAALGFKDQLVTAYQIEGRSGLEAAKNANAASVQATMFANAASVEATKNFYQTSLEAQKNAAAILAAQAECCCEIKQQAADLAAKAELTARTLAAEAARQAAQCCCELKEKIDRQEIDRLRDRALRLDGAYNVLANRTVPPSPPIV